MFNKTRRRRAGGGGEMSVIKCSLELLNTIKLYHWTTARYIDHKISDELLSKLEDNLDKYIEVMLSYHAANRAAFCKNMNLSVKCCSSRELVAYLERCKKVFHMKRPELENIRDEMISDINQFIYLLSFV